MWTDAVQLLSAVRQIVAAKAEDRERLAVPFLERLKRHEQSLVAPMKNRPRSPADLERLRTKKVQLDGLGEVDLDESLIEEALILAGLFGLNELDAVDLLLIGELQSPEMDGLPRGLLAVASYFDAKRIQVAVLAKLLTHDLTNSIASFVKERLATCETFKALLNIVQSTSVEATFNQLAVHPVNGLGPANHRRMIESALLETVEFSGRAALSLVSRCGDEQRDRLADEVLGRLKCVPAGDTLDARRLLEWATLVRLILTASEQEDDVASVALLERIATATSPESSGKKTDDWADAAILASIQLAVACASCAVTINPGAAFVSADNIIRRHYLWLDSAMTNCAPQFLLLGVARSFVLRSHKYMRETVGAVAEELIRHTMHLFPAKMSELERVGEDELQRNYDGQAVDETAVLAAPQPKLGYFVLHETLDALRLDDRKPCNCPSHDQARNNSSVKCLSSPQQTLR